NSASGWFSLGKENRSFVGDICVQVIYKDVVLCESNDLSKRPDLVDGRVLYFGYKLLLPKDKVFDIASDSFLVAISCRNRVIPLKVLDHLKAALILNKLPKSSLNRTLSFLGPEALENINN